MAPKTQQDIEDLIAKAEQEEAKSQQEVDELAAKAQEGIGELTARAQ